MAGKLRHYWRLADSIIGLVPNEQSLQIGEFELIERLQSVLRQNAGEVAPDTAGVLLGIGDDAAVLSAGPGPYLFTTDTMVDGVHFRSGEIPWFELGWKSIVSNQSDIAAMGGSPLHALVSLGVPAQHEPEQFEEMYRGMRAACEEFGGVIAGGDVVASPVLFVTVALTGSATLDEDGEPLIMRRDTAAPGDLVAVTGTLGGPAGGLRVLREGRSGAAAEALTRMHFLPRARVQAGQELVSFGIITAIDISDGLAGDLKKICLASDVGAVIDAQSVPMPVELTDEFGDEALQMALAGGEDYELLITAPFDVADRVLARMGRGVKHIGRIVDAPDSGPHVTVRDRLGNPVEVTGQSWDHLL